MSAELTNDEIDFLKHHGMTAEDVFDWRGLRAVERGKKLKAAGKLLALGLPCAKYGHRLRTRAGHCAQCDPAKIAYQSRKNTRAVLYAAFSESLMGFKVGISENPVRRIGDLNRESYGGVSDWDMFMAREINDAGKSEAAIHRTLFEFRRVGRYRKGDHEQDTREIFCCASACVIKAFQTSITKSQLIVDGYSKPPPNS